MDNLLVNVSPHMKATDSVPRIMWSVVGALMPALVASVLIFGVRGLFVVALSVVVCVATEAIIQKLIGKPITVTDGSAVVTGILYSFCLPPGAPWYVIVVGGAVAIGIAKQVFGGLGCNIWNPALIGRAFVVAAFASQMTTLWINPSTILVRMVRDGGELTAADLKKPDAVTHATPLNAVKSALTKYNNGEMAPELARKVKFGTGTTPSTPQEQLNHIYALNWTDYKDLLWGTRGGSVGETCTVALLVGGIFLIGVSIVPWQIPVSFIVAVMFFGWLLPVKLGDVWAIGADDPIFHVLTGGVVLGAFFMATDMVTSPLTRTGMAIFGVGCGLLTVVIRKYGGYPEGVCYSILLMNTVTPIIDRYTKPKPYGH